MRRMRHGRGVLGTMVLTLAATGGAGHGQDNGPQGVTLEEMSRRLADLERQNQTLLGRVNELESEEGDLWLSEQRATEIRGVVTDVLADADSRTSLQSSGMTAGWDGGFFLQSPDARFRLNVGGMAQIRYLYSKIRKPFAQADGGEFAAEDDVIQRHGLDIPHARLDFDGHMFGRDTTYRIMGQFTNQRSEWFSAQTNPIYVQSAEYGTRNGNLQLLDAWVAHSFDSSFTVKVGQFKLPFDLGWEIGIPNQLTGDRTSVALHMGLGRSQGIELAFGGDDIRARVAFSEGATDRLFEQYRLAVTDPANSPYYATQAELSVSTRIEWKLAGAWSDFERMTSPPGEEFGLMLGLGAHFQRNKVNLNPTAKNNTTNPRFGGNKYNNWGGVTGDVTANFGGASVSASGYYHNVGSGSSFLIYSFNPVSNTNPTLDVGNVQLLGASLYGSMYVTPEVELYTGVDWMTVFGDNNLEIINDISPDIAFYNAYVDPVTYMGLTLGTTFYVDGEDFKIGASVTYFPKSVSPNWNTPELGVRSTPATDEYTLRGYVQLLF